MGMNVFKSYFKFKSYFSLPGTAVELNMVSKAPTLSEDVSAALWHDDREMENSRLTTMEDEEASAMLAGQMLADVVNYTSVIVDSELLKLVFI
jgi:hypothetical protein